MLYSGFVAELVYRQVPKDYEIMKTLLMCTYLTLALCLLLCFKHLLVKEPVTQNPFKLVYKIVRYAIKNKYAKSRSAFTYCEDELPSRIDFGKIKYGGPFTTEQVEDLKTFFRLLVIVAITTVSFSVIFAIYPLIMKLFNMMSVTEDSHKNVSELHWYSKHTFVIIFFYSWSIVLPLYEF